MDPPTIVRYLFYPLWSADTSVAYFLPVFTTNYGRLLLLFFMILLYLKFLFKLIDELNLGMT